MYDHMYLGPFLAFRYASDRVYRFGILLAVVFATMAVTVFFYSLIGVDRSGIDEDGDGIDDVAPLSMQERMVFAVIAALSKFPIVLLLGKLMSAASEEQFKMRYFPLWREMEVRGAAEAHLGLKLQHLRQSLRILRTRRLAHCYVQSKSVAGDPVLKEVDRLLSIDAFQQERKDTVGGMATSSSSGIDIGTSTGNESHVASVRESDDTVVSSRTNGRNMYVTSASLDELAAADVALHSHETRQRRILDLRSRLQMLHSERLRLEIARLAAAAGHELTRGHRCQVDFFGFRVSTMWCQRFTAKSASRRVSAFEDLAAAVREYEHLPKSENHSVGQDHGRRSKGHVSSAGADS